MSFNGRTADSGSANWGSNPCTPAKLDNDKRGHSLLCGMAPFIIVTRNFAFNFKPLRYKTLANFLRIVKVGVRVALILLARYNVQSNAENNMT